MPHQREEHTLQDRPDDELQVATCLFLKHGLERQLTSLYAGCTLDPDEMYPSRHDRVTPISRCVLRSLITEQVAGPTAQEPGNVLKQIKRDGLNNMQTCCG